MDMEALSVSRLNTNKDCNFKYFLQYHMKLPQLRKPTIYTEKGVAVHEVLELYAKGDKNWIENLRKYYVKTKLWELDRRKAEKGGFPHPQPKTCETCTWNDGGLCKLAELGKDSFEGCPRPNFEDDLELVRRVMAREGEDNFLSREIIGAEVEFDLTVRGIHLKGVIDLVTKLDDDTLEIIDYKTGRHCKTNASLVKDPQVRTYSVVAKILWPQFKYRLMTLDYLRKAPISTMFTDDDDEATILSLIHHNNDIRTNINPRPFSYKMWLCDFCVGHDNCVEMHKSLKKNGKFQLPVISCSFKDNNVCWGPMSCVSDIITNDLTQLIYACQGHKEILNGGDYIKENVAPKEKPKEVIECD
jgi:RecB family exonuclease